MKLAKMAAMTAAFAATIALPALGEAPRTSAPTGDERVKIGVDAWQAGNYDSAVTIWRPLAQAGNPDAQFNLAQAYRLGHGVAADPKIAMDLYHKAALQDHEQALATYGLMLFQNGDQKGAMPWLQKASNRGDPRAMYVVGTAQFNGDMLPKDWVSAYTLMTRAAAAGLPQAKTSLSEMERYLTLDQRQKGTALAAEMERGAGPGPVRAPSAAYASAAPDRQTPPVIRTTELPPSRPAAPRPAPAPEPVKLTHVAAPAPARIQAASTSGWRVQLGAYSSAEKAKTLWESLSHKVTPLHDKQPYLVSAGAITRLQAGPFADRSAASKACVAAKAAGQDCFPTSTGS